MTNRVCLGAKGSAYGLWVSKAGYDVLTTTDDHLLFSSARRTMQVIESGSASYPAQTTIEANATKTITHADYGFRPYVVLKFPGFTDAQYMTNLAFYYNAVDTANTYFSLARPRVADPGDSNKWAAFTVEYYLLSIGYGNL